MNVSKMSQFILGAALLALLPVVSYGQSNPLPITLGMQIGYRPDLGETAYDFGVGEELSVYTAIRLMAPDGTVFSNPSQQPFRFELLTLSELTSRFVGEWTLLDSFQLLPGESPRVHPFSITADQLTTFPASPHIISPPDGAHLPPRFSYQATGDRMTIRGSALTISNAKVIGGEGEFDLRPFASSLPQVFQARTSTITYDVVGSLTVGGDPARQVLMQLSKTNWSPPKAWTVSVPEPATMSSLAIGAISVAGLRRRK